MKQDTHKDIDGPTSWWGAFWLGARNLPLIPALTLFSTAIGFGALAKTAGIDFFGTFLISTLVFALPAQVVFADEWARGASLFAIAIAVTLTAVRLLPMTVSLLPTLRDESRPKSAGSSLQTLIAAHFIAITSWLEAQRLMPKAGARRNRMPFFIGLGTALSVATTIGGSIGFLIAGDVGAVGGAVLLFMTPIYFFISLLASARIPTDWIAIAAGTILGPILFLWIPNFALMLCGLVGGTAAYLIGRRLDRNKGGRS